MVKREAVGVERPGRTWSLRREWSTAFNIMLVFLLVASIGTFAGVRQLVGRFSGSADQLDRTMTLVASLDAALVDHENVAHQLISGTTVDRTAFLGKQDDISHRFDEARQVLPAGGASGTILARARTAWQAAMTNAGLWGDHVRTFTAPASQVEPRTQIALRSDSNAARGFLDDLQKPALDAMHKGLAAGAGLDRLLMAALAGLFSMAVAVTVYFRRRMSKDLVRPVASLHQGVLKLQAGEYDHRIKVARRDELGELAEAFNGMAVALHDSHLALTSRATHDSLTGLPNRALLTERLTASFSPGSDRRSRQESVLFIDIDDFKDVNDSLGHEGGDALLVQLAARLKGCVRPHDLVARLGGDEFAIVVIDSDRGATAVEVAERILAAVHAPFLVYGTCLTVAVSIGVAHRGPETADTAELLRHADFAMYMAKGRGKGRYQLFDTQMHENMVGHAALKAELAVAVTSGQLRLEYQPVTDLRTGEVVGVEALVRWQHPTRGLLGPGDFIPLAEETGVIESIGCWVLDTATRQAAAWRHAMDHCADLWVSVNLSAFQLANAHSRTAIESILSDPAAEADKVILEVTETALATNIDGGLASLNLWKRHGVRIAIDDFGTGFSSLSTLGSLPVDILKIDRSFVSGQASVTPSVPMLEGILGLAAKLSLEVIAEGIEAPEQLDLLRTLGCHMGQGFLLARPTSVHALETLLAGVHRPAPAPGELASQKVELESRPNPIMSATVLPCAPVDGKLTVLLADDEAPYRSVLKRILEGSGHFRVVAEAIDGQMAVEQAERHHPDLVLLDLTMPKMSGLEALPQILVSSPGSKVALLSGHIFPDRNDLIAEGASAHLSKVVKPSQLVEELLLVANR